MEGGRCQGTMEKERSVHWFESTNTIAKGWICKYLQKKFGVECPYSFYLRDQTIFVSSYPFYYGVLFLSFSLCVVDPAGSLLLDPISVFFEYLTVFHGSSRGIWFNHFCIPYHEAEDLVELMLDRLPEECRLGEEPIVRDPDLPPATTVAESEAEGLGTDEKDIFAPWLASPCIFLSELLWVRSASARFVLDGISYMSTIILASRAGVKAWWSEESILLFVFACCSAWLYRFYFEIDFSYSILCLSLMFMTEYQRAYGLAQVWLRYLDLPKMGFSSEYSPRWVFLVTETWGMFWVLYTGHLFFGNALLTYTGQHCVRLETCALREVVASGLLRHAGNVWKALEEAKLLSDTHSLLLWFHFS